MRSNNLECFEAWCSGTAYNFVDRYVAVDTVRSISIYTNTAYLAHTTYLAQFFFKTVNEYKQALRIAKRSVSNAILKQKELIK